LDKGDPGKLIELTFLALAARDLARAAFEPLDIMQGLILDMS